MAIKSPKIFEKSREIDLSIRPSRGTFSILFRRFGITHPAEGLSELAILRSILSNEKARILHAIKSQKPDSVYGLARLLGRDFKAVSRDVRLLEHFGIIRLEREKKGNTTRLRPVLDTDVFKLTIRL